MNNKKYVTPIYQLRFSNWHYQKLNNFCSAFNIDFVETRYGKVVALVEYKRKKEDMTQAELKYLPMLSKMLNIPYYIVICDINEDLDIIGKIIVEGEKPNGDVVYKELKEEELIKFFEEIGKENI